MADRYRKRPIVIEAVQLTDRAGIFDIRQWIEAGGGYCDQRADGLDIQTLEGRLRVSIGDWVIRGVAGEYYPCKPDIFDATYEAVDG